MSYSPDCVARLRVLVLLIAVAAVLTAVRGASAEEAHHVWQKVEIILKAQRDYAHPFRDVDVWVDLEGPGFRRRYQVQWFDPRSGQWIAAGVLMADLQGKLRLPDFPGGASRAADDWALKLQLAVADTSMGGLRRLANPVSRAPEGQTEVYATGSVGSQRRQRLLRG